MTTLVVALAACSRADTHPSDGTPASSAVARVAGSAASAKQVERPGPVPSALTEATAVPKAAPPGDWAARSRPGATDWSAARLLDEAGACRAEQLGDWVRLRCIGRWGALGDGYWSRFEDWGTVNVDYFDSLSGTTELRLRRGQVASGMHRPSGVRVSIAWPTKASAPIVSLRAGENVSGTPPAPQAVPLIALADAPRPVEADWFVATPVNTASSTPGKHCSLRVLGQWARLECACQLAAIAQWVAFEGFGEPDKDVSRKQLATPHQMVRLDFRLRKGGSGRARVTLGLDHPDVAVRYDWPADAPQPTVLSFEETRR